MVNMSTSCLLKNELATCTLGRIKVVLLESLDRRVTLVIKLLDNAIAERMRCPFDRAIYSLGSHRTDPNPDDLTMASVKLR